jgi:hypothetical protein
MMKVWTDAAEAGLLDRIDAAISRTTADVRAYITQQPEFAETGERMLQEWEKGAAFSLHQST